MFLTKYSLASRTVLMKCEQHLGTPMLCYHIARMVDIELHYQGGYCIGAVQ